MKVLLLACLLPAFINISECARILGIFHGQSYSHNAGPNALTEELARKGHELTVVTAFPRKPSLKNIRDIDVSSLLKSFDDVEINPFELDDINFVLMQVMFNNILINSTDELLGHENIQKLINSNDKFDLVIIEDFVSPSMKAFAHHFNAPCIMLNSMGLTRMVSPQVGNPYNPSYMPDIFLAYSGNMNFFQRLHNSFTYLFSELFHNLYVIPRHNNLIQKHFPNPPSHLNDIYYNVSLLLLNAHASVQQVVPYVPNVIDVGGLHIKPPKKLPKDLQEYLDNAKDGVIFFSMGSNLRSTQLHTEKREAILKTFAKLKQKVLWKFEDENLPGKPSNVKIGKWLPQSDILAHPNVKLFITHGGLLSQLEAVDRAVPVLGIPIYGDQKVNMRDVELNKRGLTLAYSVITEENLSSKIQELLSNPQYKKNAKKFSQIMHDQPIKPLEKAVFWVEYVLRHKGAYHLRTAAVDLTWYQYLLLDVILFIAVLVFASIALFYVAIRKFVCAKKNLKSIAKKKKKD